MRSALGLERPDCFLVAQQVAIITGGNAGIGYATAKELVQRGAHVIIACRDAGRGTKAAQVGPRVALARCTRITSHHTLRR